MDYIQLIKIDYVDLFVYIHSVYMNQVNIRNECLLVLHMPIIMSCTRLVEIEYVNFSYTTLFDPHELSKIVLHLLYLEQKK